MWVNECNAGSILCEEDVVIRRRHSVKQWGRARRTAVLREENYSIAPNVIIAMRSSVKIVFMVIVL